MRDSKSKVPPEPPQEEWDFSACPHDQVKLCLHYEYTRQLALEYFKVIKKPYSKELFRSCFASYYRKGKSRATESLWSPYSIESPGADLLETKCVCALILSDLPGFPATPFLRSPLDLNSKNILATWISRHQRSGLLTSDPVVVRSFSDVSYYAFHPADLPKEIGPNLDFFRRLFHILVKMNMKLLTIDWSHSDNQIVDSFANWVGQNRPRSIKAKESRGPTLPRERLKQLGALRLLDVMSASQAGDLTQGVLPNRQPLYREDGTWYKNVKKSRLTMKQLFDPFFRFDNKGRVQRRRSSPVDPWSKLHYVLVAAFLNPAWPPQGV